MKKIHSTLKHLIPWLLAALIFAYLFRLYPPAQVIAAIKHVDIIEFSLLAIAYFAIHFFVDSWSIYKLLNRFSRRVRFSDILAGRGATYPIMVVSYPAGQAAFAYYLKRKYGIPIFEALGTFVFIMGIDLGWLMSFALIGSFFQEAPYRSVDLGQLARTVALCSFAAAFVWLAFWRKWPERFIHKHIRVPLLEGLRRRRVFKIFNGATLLDYLRVFAMRAPLHIAIILSMPLGLLTFERTLVPLVKVLANLPIVFMVGVLPITPGGLGTTNIMLVELLSPYMSGSLISGGIVTPEELIFAATILWELYNYSLKIILGVAIFTRISRSLFRPTPGISEERAEHEAAHLGGNY